MPAVNETRGVLTGRSGGPGRSSPVALAAAVAGLAAGWIAAGSTGLSAHSLRHGLTWAALGVATVAAWPRQSDRGLARLVLLAVAAGLAVFMIASPLGPLNVLAVPLVLAALAQGLPAENRTALLRAAEATLVLAVYRLAYTSIPLVWYAADALGWAMGSVAALCTRRPLWVGATMGGVDYLVPMLYLAVALPIAFGGPSHASRTLKRILLALFAVLLGSLFYLLVLAFAADLLAAIAADRAATRPFLSSASAATLRKLVPWNLPALAAAIQCGIAWGLFRCFTPEGIERAAVCSRPPRRLATTAGVACLAAAIPVAIVLCWARPDVADKKIVFFEKGYVNWLKPEHGQYGQHSVGMYGMLPAFLESLGARPLVSPDLSEADLEDAAALVVIYPNEPWKEGQLERIDAFVRERRVVAGDGRAHGAGEGRRQPDQRRSGPDRDARALRFSPVRHRRLAALLRRPGASDFGRHRRRSQPVRRGHRGERGGPLAGSAAAGRALGLGRPGRRREG